MTDKQVLINTCGTEEDKAEPRTVGRFRLHGEAFNAEAPNAMTLGEVMVGIPNVMSIA